MTEDKANQDEQSAEMLDELRRQKTFYENALAALPVRLIIVDQDLNILLANPAYCRPRGLMMEEVCGRNLADMFPTTLLDEAGLRAAIGATLQTGERVQWSGYRQATPDHGERTLNIRLDPVDSPDGRRNALLTIEDVTERHRQLYERSVLQQVAQAMLGTLELPRLLHAILTGMTAGGAVGLGFNRAFLMLVQPDDVTLRVEMAVGPADPDEAYKIWSEVTAEYATIEDFLADYDNLPPPEQNPFYTSVSQLLFTLEETDQLPLSVLYDGKTAHVVDASHDPRVSRQFYDLLKADEFVVAPLQVEGRCIGVAYADNHISRRPISPSDAQLFTSLSNHAALSIDRAAAYEELQHRAAELEEAYEQLTAAQERSLRSESLAAVGVMTAIVAHEIRNPLTTIGGFANLMHRQADDRQKVERNAGVIADEVNRLEEILNGLLAFSRPGNPQFRWYEVCRIVQDSVEMLEKVKPENVQIATECSDDLPNIYIDPGQIHQVLDNLMRNGLDAMPEGGTITVSALIDSDNRVTINVADTGNGIPNDSLDKIFDTFFTTKSTGMGLGLALCKKIMSDHEAEMLVESEPEHGTIFSLIFPADNEKLLQAGNSGAQAANSAHPKGE
ncbi:MAG: PAS domain-containing protein [candidate division WS1 bacterium]|jgi:PAS domain S-box-containing protein|nr:PAS domain-containing protein [candidate division WS1 bacterium]